MLRTSARPIAAVVIAVMLLSPSSFAFTTPLSDQAVREAYFLGQRGDETMATFLNKYTKFLEAPKTGPALPSLCSPLLHCSSSNPASIPPVTVPSKPRSIIAIRENL